MHTDKNDYESFVHCKDSLQERSGTVEKEKYKSRIETSHLDLKTSISILLCFGIL